MLNDVEQLKHLLAYDLGLAEKDCGWHSPLLTYAQLKSLKNMRIRSKESEDKRREKWMQKTQGYLEKREERKDSVRPLRTDSHRNVGRTRSRSVSRTRSYRPKTETPAPPPAPARGPAVNPKPVQYKAATDVSQTIIRTEVIGIFLKCSAACQGTSSSGDRTNIRFTTAKNATRSARSTEDSTAVEGEIAAGRPEANNQKKANQRT